MSNKQKGFSLIELLIVVAIILIIAAIAIPNLLRSKMAANEASAVGSLRTINTASVAYSTTYGSYPTNLVSMETNGTVGSSAADLIDTVLGSGVKSGYDFSYTPNQNTFPVTSYSVTAIPASASTGQRTFYTDQSGVIRADATGSTATSSSTPIS